MARRGYGEGSITRRPDGRYEGRLSLGVGADGKRRRRSVYGKTRREVLEKMQALRLDVHRGRPVDTNRMTFAELFEDWMDLRSDRAQTTISSYQAYYRRYIEPEFGHMRVRDIDHRMINRLYARLDERGLSDRVVAYVRLLLQSPLDLAVNDEVIAINPARRAAKRTYRPGKARCFTAGELVNFLDALDMIRPSLADGMLTGFHTGMRPGEWLGLPEAAIEWSGRIDIYQAYKEDGGQQIIGGLKRQTGQRNIAVNSEVLEAQRRLLNRRELLAKKAGGEWKNEHNLVITTRTGRPVWFSTLSDQFRRVCARAGIEGATPHTLRHTHASILIAMKVPLPQIAYRLGHVDAAVTMRYYAHLLTPADDEAAEQTTLYLDSLSAIGRKMGVSDLSLAN